MQRSNKKGQNYLPTRVSQQLIEQVLNDMKQQLIHWFNKQTRQILNVLLTNIRAKFVQQLTILTQDYHQLMDQLTYTQTEHRKIAVEVQHFHEENQNLRAELEIMKNQNTQYLEEMNISKHELCNEKNLTFQQQQQKIELYNKVRLYQQKIQQYEEEIHKFNQLFEKERERNEELEILLRNLDQNLKDINKKYDDQHWKYEELSSNLSHKEKRIEELKLIIEQSDYISSMSPKTRQKYNFKMSLEQYQSFQDNQLQQHQQQTIKLYQSGYPLSRELQDNSIEENHDLSKELHVTKKIQEIPSKKTTVKKVTKPKIESEKELKLIKKSQSLLPKKSEPDEKEKDKSQIRRRLNTIFTDRVTYRVNVDLKMEGLKCKLSQKEKQCQRLNKMLHAKSSDKNNSSFLKKSFQNSRTISKKSEKELKHARKQQSSSRIKQYINRSVNRSASQNLSQASHLSNSIQNFEQYDGESHSKKQDEFQEFGLSPDKLRHHYLNSEFDVQGDTSFKMLQRHLDESAQLSYMDVRSKGNQSILDSSLQLQTAQLHNQSNLGKMDQIEVEENRSPLTPLKENRHSQELEVLDLNEESDERQKQEQKNLSIPQQRSEEKEQSIQVLDDASDNQVCEYQMFYRLPKKEYVEEMVNTYDQNIRADVEVQTQNQAEQKIFCDQEMSTVKQSLQISLMMELTIAEHRQKQQQQIQTEMYERQQFLLENEERNHKPPQIFAEDKYAQHQSKLSLQIMDGLTIQPIQRREPEIYKSPFGIFQELNYKIQQQKPKILKTTSLSELSKFEGIRVVKSSTGLNTQPKILGISVQQSSQILVHPTKTLNSLKSTQLSISNLINIIQRSSFSHSESQPSIYVVDQLWRESQYFTSIASQKSQNLQVKEKKDPPNRYSLNLMSPSMYIHEQNEVGVSRQIDSARTRSSSQEKLQPRQPKELINEITEQKESNSSKMESSSSAHEIRPDDQIQVLMGSQQDQRQIEVNDIQRSRVSSYQCTPENVKRDHPKYIENTAHSYATASMVKQFFPEREQVKLISQSEQQIIKSYFFDLKSYEQVSSINLELQPDTKNIFAQPHHMFVLQSEQDKCKSKFALWKGKILHIDDKVSFMQMAHVKHLKTRPQSNHLILGNSEFTLIGNKLTIDQKNKIKSFRGQMPQGEWRVSTITTYKTQITK